MELHLHVYYILDVEECFQAPCLNGGTCHELMGSYSCTCPPGFTGLTCDKGKPYLYNL